MIDLFPLAARALDDEHASLVLFDAAEAFGVEVESSTDQAMVVTMRVSVRGAPVHAWRTRECGPGNPHVRAILGWMICGGWQKGRWPVNDNSISRVRFDHGATFELTGVDLGLRLTGVDLGLRPRNGERVMVYGLNGNASQEFIYDAEVARWRPIAPRAPVPRPERREQAARSRGRRGFGNAPLALRANLRPWER